MRCGLPWTGFLQQSIKNFLSLGQGVEIVNDELGNVWATRGSKNNIFVEVGENVQ